MQLPLDLPPQFAAVKAFMEGSSEEQMFETEMKKAIPSLNSGLLFRKERDGSYIYPEARMAFLAFKLGAHMVMDKVAEPLIDGIAIHVKEL